MTRRAMLLVLTAIVLVSLSGCMGGGPGIDKAAIEAEIGQVIRDFEAGIEAYDVGALLACLSDDFELTLEEAGDRYQKDLSTLRVELENDEEDQLAWRQPVLDGGHGYRLDLRLDKRAFFSVTAVGATVTEEFTVAEWATGIPVIITDQGDIIWDFVKVGGEWKVTKLYINFKPVGTKAAGIRAAGAESRGFGFGVGYEGLAK